MKKYLFFVIAALVMVSCTTTTKTARTESVPYSMYNATVADLEVASERVTYTFAPAKEIRRAGLRNCKMAAIQEALSANGNADIMLEPQFVVSRIDGLFRHKITSVTVSGRPAKYKNFRSLDDKVWCDPVFRGVKGTQFHIFNGAPCEKSHK